MIFGIAMPNGFQKSQTNVSLSMYLSFHYLYWLFRDAVATETTNLSTAAAL